jgi:hypothetical protein
MILLANHTLWRIMRTNARLAGFFLMFVRLDQNERR